MAEDSGEKVQIAEDCYAIVDRYIRKLDLELHKFKVSMSPWQWIGQPKVQQKSPSGKSL